MKKVALMCDSSADITEEEAKALDIHVLRMPITIDGKEYIDSKTISDNDIIEALRAEKQVKTAQPVIGDMVNMWIDLLKDYDEVFYLPLSNKLSGTCQTAIGLSKKFEGRVHVVDSELVCYPVVSVLKMARELLEEGYSCAQVKKKIEDDGELYAVIIPENLTALKNGGRISPAAAALAGLLKIQPLLSVEQGAIDLVDKVRTLKKAYREGIERVTKDIHPEDYIWMIIDADTRAMSDELKPILEEACGQPVEQRTFKAVILTHTGPGTIGFGRIRKLK